MVEIKFLKELPVRSLNKSPLIQLNGADIYVDKDANRFAFFGFKNYTRSPMFSLYLVIKQYDSYGSFIRESKFSLPSIYAPSGTYITEKPVRLADECEGCEVYVAYAEFQTKQFYKDRIVKKSYLSDFTEDRFAGAPTSVTCTIKSNFVVQKDAPVSPTTKVEEEKKVEPFVKPEVAPSTEAPVQEAPATEAEVAKESETQPVFSQPLEDVLKEEEQKSSIKHFRRHFDFVNLIILGATTAAIVVLAIVLYFIF